MSDPSKDSAAKAPGSPPSGLKATSKAEVDVPETRTIEVIAARTKTPAAFAAALKARHGWPVGKTMTEAEYLAKLDQLMHGRTDGQPTEKPAKDGDE